MNTDFKLYTQVQLTKDIPQYNFVKGDVATLVDFVKDKQGSNGCVLEFFDNHGNTLQVIVVAEDYISLTPEHGVVNYRPYKVA